MAKRINQDLCIQCGSCLDECMNAGITETEAVYMIDPRLCEECSGFSGLSRCEEVCPVNAIEQDDWDWGDVMHPIHSTGTAKTDESRAAGKKDEERTPAGAAA
jgi:ferredoxin